MGKSLTNTLGGIHLNPHSLVPNDDISTSNLSTGKSNDIEMMEMNYTSLKDLMPVSPPSTPSPTGSWKEIPIKDPLLQHAAWAYLQPMVATRDEDSKWWKMLRQRFCGIFGCVNEIVLVMFYGWLSEHCGEDRVKLIE